jgi:putative PIN family toxin of toxin-antitoxin system
MTAGSLKVVFDTNILVSGHFWKGPPYRCLLAVEAGLATLVLSDPILTEFGETLTSKFGVSKSEADPILERWTMRAEVARTEGKAGWVLQDPDDDEFVETALVGGATIIVSGDRHLLALGKVEGIEILTARQILDRLAAASSDL